LTLEDLEELEQDIESRNLPETTSFFFGNESGDIIMDFIFSIKNHYFEKGTPWVELDKIKQRCWFLSVDIEDDETVPCYDTEDERYSTGVDFRIDEDITFKSVQILTSKTQETHPYWEALLDMSYLYSTELRDVTFKDLPNENGIYMLNIWFDYDGEELNFGDWVKLDKIR